MMHIQRALLTSGVITPSLRAGMDDAQAAGLGARSDRSASKPFNACGRYEGGAQYERSDQAVHVGNAPRCYTLGQSYQIQRNVVGPTASAKVQMGDRPTPHMDLRQRMLTEIGRAHV